MQQGVRGMWGALFFWLLAGYGALCIVWQASQRLRRRFQRPRPLSLVLVVENAEDEIEGILRLLLLRTAFGMRERRIVVLDAGSTDDTGAIVQRLCQDNPALSYVRVADPAHWLDALAQLCLASPHVSCVYDLRQRTSWHDTIQDLQWLVHG